LSAAIVELYNGLVDMEDPAALTASDVKSVGDRFGISMQRDQLDGLKKIYGQFLENIIPTGGQRVHCWMPGAPLLDGRQLACRCIICACTGCCRVACQLSAK
jgi:hypothetical protein